MISILIVACISLSAGDPPTQKGQLEFLAATQEQTQATYAKLSYDAVVTGTSYVRELNRPLTQTTTIQVRTRSSTTIVTWIAHTSLTSNQNELGEQSAGSGVTVSDKPLTMMVLKAPTYIAFWGIVEIPSIKVHFFNDWKDNPKYYDQSYTFVRGPADILQICFGHFSPFFESYRKPNQRGKWSVPSFEPTAQTRVQREIPDSGGVYKLDLALTLYAEDGLLKDSKFEPIDDASISTRRIEYTQFQVGESLVRVPLKYIRDSKAIGKPETENDTSVKFKNFSDESALPPFTVSDMGLPQGASIKRAFPDNRIERIDWDRFVELSNK